MNALQFQKKLLSMQENMMNFALMLTANRDRPGFDARHNAESFGQSGKVCR